ncbi:NADPH:quinone oxidoreductase family protein [Halioxenophilus sp. WMMB6]|uniref:NADPH:quinone oxidoreductase family protein n=1 Tax=Halioxenophilus sp. WMMB6 TaxID=3073815 RepID=UPI00295E2D97|nr:NADPH:quinone oxidoreductase family protein [Halioxenophilus sp. WMMB6]
MKAVICQELGPPEALALGEFPITAPGPDEIQVRVAACGVNFPDLLVIEGTYQERPPLPFVPCGEVAGRVHQVGSQVSTFKPGDPVIAIPHIGGLAEFVNVPAGQVYPRPETMPETTAAGFIGVYGTAYHALKQRAQLQPGETLLVLGAGGGVGHAAVQLGAAMGARVIAAASSDAKLDQLPKQGADTVINYSKQNLRDAVKELTGGRGADVIFDPVGGDLFDQATRCINWNGRLLVIGFAAGRIPQLPINLLLLKGASAVGVFYGRFEKEEPAAARQNIAELCELYARERINPHIHGVYPLEQYAQALNTLKQRQALGKVIIKVADQ